MYRCATALFGRERFLHRSAGVRFYTIDQVEEMEVAMRLMTATKLRYQHLTMLVNTAHGLGIAPIEMLRRLLDAQGGNQARGAA